MNSLPPFYMGGRNLLLLTICLPKLLTLACALRRAAQGEGSYDQMTTESSLQRTQRDVVEQLRVHGWTWAGCGAFCGLCLGLISPITDDSHCTRLSQARCAWILH